MSKSIFGLPSRRQFLRGAGVALAIPWLESIPLLAHEAGPPTAAAAAANAPLRFGVIYFSNGVEPAHWWAKGEGADDGARPRRSP